VAEFWTLGVFWTLCWWIDTIKAITETRSPNHGSHVGMSIFSRIFNCLVVMDERELKLRRDYLTASNAKLREIRESRGPATPERAIIDEILSERAFWHKFWTSGIVAWLSLVVAITALVISLWHKL
jgi:hypothetical protein